jgi:Ca-activated chloride channel family protein
MSLSSAQRIEYAIARNLPLPREHIRPHELLNYYSFRTAPVPEGETFSVTAELAPGETEGYSLLLAIQGRPVSRDARRPVVLTLLVDVSGSMREAGKIDLLKRGLLLLLEQLKSGDVVNVVAFDQESRRLLTGFRVGQDDLGRLRSVVEGLAPGGSTDLNRGLETAYQAAQETKDAEKGSRVLLITDALANTGVVDERLVSAIGKGLDEQGIRLSGIGVGADFNDSLLDRLTERGRGAYVFLGSEDVVDRVFGEGFVSLIETIAEDVRFRLDLPVSLAMERFYGEEASTVESRVQAIHYFAGTSQVFLSDLAKGERDPEASDVVSLTVRYRDPATSQPQEKVFSFPVAEIRSDPSANLRKARLLMAWADGLAETAGGDRPGGDAAKAADTCTRLREDLGGRARSLAEDADVGRVVELLDTYCSRFRATVAEVPPEAPEGAPRGTVRVTPRPDPGNAGRMTGDVFRAVFLRKRPGIERCYDSALLNDAALGGEVTFLLTINAAGTVSVEVTANSDSLEAAGVTTCVAYRLRSLNFASTPPRGGDFRVRLPYTFIPPAAGAARAAVPIVSPPPTGARAPTPPAPTPPAPPPPASAVAGARWLRLVVILTKGSIHLMASRRVAAEVMPGEATATGVRGRIDIPHRTQRVRDAEAERPAACAAPAVPGEFDDCAYLEYLGELLRSCYGNPEGPVMVPDLEAFSIALGEIQDRASQAFGDGLGDIDAINFEVEDDIPFCQVVALIDFSRFRDFAYDWTADAEFRAGVDEAVAKGLDGVSDVLFEPTVWTAAMRRRLLFPVWGLVY